MSVTTNKKTLLVLGGSGTGKTFSLKELVMAEGDKITFIDIDGKNALPFRGKNKIHDWIVPTDPLTLVNNLQLLEDDPVSEYIVVDTLSHWLRKLEQKYVVNSDDSRGAWGKVYQQALFELLDFATSTSKKTWIFLSHTVEGDLENNQIPIKAFVKGSTKNVGVESFFQFVIYTNITNDDDEESLTGLKYRLQLSKTKDSKNLSVKTPEDFYPEPFLEEGGIKRVIELIEEYDNE